MKNTPTRLLKQQKLLLLVAASLALIVLSTGIGGIGARVAHADDGGSSNNGASVSTTIGWTFVQGSDPGSSYFIITLSATNSGSKPLNLEYNLDTYLNTNIVNGAPVGGWGNLVSEDSCGVQVKGSSTSSCTIIVSFYGNGEYTWAANGCTNNGSVCTNAVLDPLIEPEWQQR